MQIQFRSPTEKPISVSSTFGTCAVVGPEFREIPSGLHRLALELGCISNTMTQESYIPEDAEPRVEGVDERLRDVLRSMKRAPGPDDFTKSGLPNLVTLAKTLGYGVVRDDVIRVWTEINAEETSE